MAKAKYAIQIDGNVTDIDVATVKEAKQAFVQACAGADGNVSEISLVLTRTVATASRGFVVARAPRKPRDPNAPKRIRKPKVAADATTASQVRPPVAASQRR